MPKAASTVVQTGEAAFGLFFIRYGQMISTKSVPVTPKYEVTKPPPFAYLGDDHSTCLSFEAMEGVGSKVYEVVRQVRGLRGELIGVIEYSELLGGWFISRFVRHPNPDKFAHVYLDPCEAGNFLNEAFLEQRKLQRQLAEVA